MKTIAAILLLGAIFLFACNKKNQQMGDDNTPPPSFGTPEEAVNKAKQDLLELLRTNKSINLGLDAAAVEKSQPGKPSRSFQVDFNRLLGQDTASTLGQFAQSGGNTIVPLVADGKALTIIEVNQDDKGWRVAGIGNEELRQGLSTVREVTGGEAEVAVYEVPNLNATVYGTSTPNGEVYYTDYGGKFNLREGVRLESLLSVLREDARAFYGKYGDLLKKQQLVK